MPTPRPAGDYWRSIEPAHKRDREDGRAYFAMEHPRQDVSWGPGPHAPARVRRAVCQCFQSPPPTTLSGPVPRREDGTGEHVY